MRSLLDGTEVVWSDETLRLTEPVGESEVDADSTSPFAEGEVFLSHCAIDSAREGFELAVFVGRPEALCRYPAPFQFVPVTAEAAVKLLDLQLVEACHLEAVEEDGDEVDRRVVGYFGGLRHHDPPTCRVNCGVLREVLHQLADTFLSKDEKERRVILSLL